MGTRLIGLLALPEDHPWAGEVAAVGQPVWSGDTGGVSQAIRAGLDVLLADAATLAPEDLDALRTFRLQRPHTRIVVRVPADAEPGGPLLSGLVALGIYDLVPVDQPLAEALARPATYADAATWGLGLDPESGNALHKPDPPVKEVVREKRVATSARPVLVTVYGTLPAVGTSSTAAELARRLQTRGHTVCFWSRAGDRPEGVPTESGTSPGPLLRTRDWEYVVADCGLAGGTDDYDPDADLVVLVLPGVMARARRDGMEPVWWPLPGAPRGAVAGPGPESRAVAEAWAAEGLGEAVAWPERARRAAGTWDRILTPVLPERSPGRWRRPKLPNPPRSASDPPDPPPSAPSGPVRVRLVGGRVRAPVLHVWSWVMGAFDTALLVGVAGLILYLGGAAAHAGVLHGPIALWAERGQGVVLAVLAHFRR